MNNAQYKGRVGKFSKTSQEHGRLPVGCVRPSRPGRREEEVNGLSSVVEELILQPLRSSSIPARV